jgi:hypothetical protein
MIWSWLFDAILVKTWVSVLDSNVWQFENVHVYVSYFMTWYTESTVWFLAICFKRSNEIAFHGTISKRVSMYRR